MGWAGEVGMDIFASPAMLGGIILFVAQGAWMLGRWQGGIMPPDGVSDQPHGAAPHVAEPLRQPHRALAPVPLAAPPIVCQQAAQDERRRTLETAASLGDLHAEISAYRRAEQVLAGIAREQLDLVLIPADARHDCRYVGLSGQPTCPMPDVVQHSPACGKTCAAFDLTPQRAVQPSPAASGFTRV